MPGYVQTEQVPGVASPAERRNSLQELAKRAPKMDVAEKEQAAKDLAGEIAHEEDPILRMEILHTLSVFVGPTADSVFRLAVNDPDADVRVYACTRWGTRSGPERVRILSGVLASDVDKDVRLAAARALGQSRDAAAAPALGNALEDPDPAMQYVAVTSLHNVTGKDLGNDVDRWRAYVKANYPKSADSPVLAGRPGSESK
jgi:HEAT repeat protein